MSKKREFPILNGKLISDLDANGHKIIGADIEVPAEKIKEAVAPELEAKADKTELEAETQRATGVEATLGNAITAEAQRAQEAEAALRGTVDGKVDKVANATAGNLATLDENGNLADSGKAIGNFALAESLAPFFEPRAYEVGDLCTSFDNDEQHKGTWLYKCILATDGSQPTPPEIDPTHWALATVEDLLAALRTALAGKADASSLAPVATSGNYGDLRGKPGNVSAFANDAGYLTAHQSWSDVKPSGGITASDLAAAVQTSLGKADTALQAHQDISGKVDKEAGKGLSTNDYTNEDKAKLGTAYTPDNPPPAPDLSGYATKDAVLPRYYFTILEVVDGVVTVPPYTSAHIPGSSGTAFTIAVGEGNGYMRDCILCVECGDVAPTITWPANFHPRTDAETDFACVAGVNNVHVTNVYWISEYAQGEFAVAGWQATAGGSAV